MEELIRQLQAALNPIVCVDEAARMLGISKPTLQNKMYAHEIPYYVAGSGAKYFKRSELEAWAFQTRIATDDELKQVKL